MKRQAQFESNSLRSWALVATMGALGNVLGLISIGLGQIPLAGVSQVALDFSNVPVVFLAIFLGKRYGALTGLIAGLGPGVMFGYITGNAGILSVIFVPLGKIFTGFFVGAIAELIATRRKLVARDVITAVLIGFIPEALLVLVYFWNIVPFFIPNLGYYTVIGLPVFVKGWAEMLIIGFLTAALAGNRGFGVFLSRYFPSNKVLVPVVERTT